MAGIPEAALRPLFGLSVLVTRPLPQAEPWLHALAAAGAQALSYPTIEVLPPPSWEPLDQALQRLAAFDWLLLSSAAAARFTIDRLHLLGVKAPPGLRIAAVGHETARTLAAGGLVVTTLPQEQRQEGLMAALKDLPAGARVLFPQAIGGRDELRSVLTRAGVLVDVVPASQTVPLLPLPPLPVFDAAVFASPSSVRAFVDAHGAGRLARKLVAAVGATTAAAAETCGLMPLVASEPTIGALIRLLANHHTPAFGPQGDP